MNKITKAFELKAAIDDNQLAGNANGIGIMDRGGDVIAPGAFKKILPSFLEKGFMAVGHDWESLPVGFFNDAKEEGGFLKIAATYHSDDVAQRARTVVKERLDAGKFVGLSIGFQADGDRCAYFESGAAMFKHLEENGGTAGFDEKTIKAWKRYCRLISGVKELFEVSIVTVPMNQVSGVTDAKSAAESENEGLPAGLSFSDHSSKVLAAAEEFVTRAEGLSVRRGEEGRTLSSAHMETFKALADRLLKLTKGPSVVSVDQIEAELLSQQARLQQASAGAL